MSEGFAVRNFLDSEVFSADLFDDGFTGGMITARPLPFFMKAYAAVGKEFGRGSADAGHQFALRIQVLVAHIERAVAEDFRDQRPELDVAARVFRPNEIAFLVVME